MSLYKSLPEGSIRLLRILPPSDNQQGIQCQLFTCALLNSGNSHAYDALSYAWGPISNGRHIYVDNHKLPVRDNLYAALSQLRDRFLERIIWIDAICINQNDNDEKSQHVQSMTKIYAKASRVIVWLGDEADKSSQALELIRKTAEEQHTPSSMSESDQQMIVKLLERPWFERVWVLQEVAAARHILIKCGSREINGHVFCSSLNMLKLSYQTNPSLGGIIPSMAYLIRGAIFRPRYQSNETGRFSLNIRPLGELVDMYHTRKATDPLDRIYALIGMSSDDPIASGLNIDYNAKWTDVFHKCVKLALPDQMSVSTWDDTDVAMIEGKGYMLGVVSSVETDSTRDDRQHLEITWQKSLHYKAAEGESLRCTLHVSAKPVQVGDAVCHLEGALSPTIIRPNQGFFTVIIIAASLAGNQPEWTKNIKTFPNQLLLIWDWGAYSRTGRDYGLNSRGVKCSRAGCLCQDHLGKAIRLWEFGISLAAMNLSQRSGIALRHALEACKTGMALRDVEDVASGHHPANKAGKEVLQMMSGILETGKAALLEENYESYGQTPLEWAAEEGHDAVVKLLLDNGTAVNATNRNGQTPLHVVANRGRQAMVQLLLDRGANMGTADQDGQLPLHIAAREGHEAVVELLLNRGADINSVSRDDQSPLFWAALNGHEPVVALLLDRGAAIHNHYYLGEGIRAIDAAYAAGTIPLNAAVKQGHKGVAKLLLDKGTYSHTPDKLGYTALYLAISNGDEALVKLLLERYADTSGSMNLVPLCQAASKGYVRIVELLLDAGAYIEERNYLDNSPLDVAAERGHDQVVKLLLKRRAIISEGNPLKLAASNGHEEIVKLLLDSGVGVDATNWSGETSLHLAASNGREMMVELLLDRGAAINAEDEYGETALQKAAWKGHEVVVNLLLDKGAAIDSQNKDGETALQKAAWKGHEAVVELLRSRGARDKKNRR